MESVLDLIGIFRSKWNFTDFLLPYPLALLSGKSQEQHEKGKRSEQSPIPSGSSRTIHPHGISLHVQLRFPTPLSQSTLNRLRRNISEIAAPEMYSAAFHHSSLSPVFPPRRLQVPSFVATQDDHKSGESHVYSCRSSQDSYLFTS